jgi:hypothetical protein
MRCMLAHARTCLACLLSEAGCNQERNDDGGSAAPRANASFRGSFVTYAYEDAYEGCLVNYEDNLRITCELCKSCNANQACDSSKIKKKTSQHISLSRSCSAHPRSCSGYLALARGPGSVVNSSAGGNCKSSKRQKNQARQMGSGSSESSGSSGEERKRRNNERMALRKRQRHCCPLCSKEFPREQLPRHAETCTGDEKEHEASTHHGVSIQQHQEKATLPILEKNNSFSDMPPIDLEAPALEEAPTFYPSLEEFADPLAYIQKISPVASRYVSFPRLHCDDSHSHCDEVSLYHFHAFL